MLEGSRVLEGCFDQPLDAICPVILREILSEDGGKRIRVVRVAKNTPVNLRAARDRRAIKITIPRSFPLLNTAPASAPARRAPLLLAERTNFEFAAAAITRLRRWRQIYAHNY